MIYLNDYLVTYQSSTLFLAIEGDILIFMQPSSKTAFCDFIVLFVSNEIHLQALYQQEGMINSIN